MGLSYTCIARLYVTVPKTKTLQKRLRERIFAALKETDDSLKSHSLKIKSFPSEEQGEHELFLECRRIFLDAGCGEDGNKLLKKLGEKIVQILDEFQITKRYLNLCGYQNERDPDIDYWHDSSRDGNEGR